MRYRLMASYQGSPFEAGIGPTDDDIVLFAACPPPEELGFEPATGHWRKQLRMEDVQAVWESRPVGIFRGERCMVLDDLGDRLHIGYLGHDGYKAEHLGYWQVDRGVFELVAPRTEVSEILEERTDYPRRTANGGGDNGRLAADQGYAHSGAHSVPSGQQVLPGQPALPGEQALTGQQALARQPALEYTPSGQHASQPSAYLDDRRDTSARRPVESITRDTATGVALPLTAEAPMPVEAEAMRAASASRRPRQTAGHSRNGMAAPNRPAPARAPVAPAPAPATHGPHNANQAAQAGQAASASAGGSRAASGFAAGQAGPALQVPPLYAVPDPVPGAALPGPTLAGPPLPEPTRAEPTQAEPTQAEPTLAGPAHAAAPTRLRRAARRRMATERLFADLASQAGIPADTYAVGEEVEGAMCLIQTDGGFEVFHCADGARHELQVFATEESACFYLFGVLAAEAVRTGSLIRLTPVRT